MSAMILAGKPSSMLAKLEPSPLNSVLSGGMDNVYRRISIKGNVFREIINGKEVRVNEDRAINVVIINAAPRSRTYFSGKYSEGEAVRPTCWSSDSIKPDEKVPVERRQSASCKTCKQDIKGSGQGEMRACRYQQRIAVMFEGALEDRAVYQLTVPSASIFADDNKKMGLNAYSRHLTANGWRAEGVITEIRFDIDSPTPKLMFKPVRYLNDNEFEIVMEMAQHPDTLKAITMSVSDMDGVTKEPFESPAPAPKAQNVLAAPAPAEKPKKTKPEPQVEEEEIEEPKKVDRKAAMPAVEDVNDIVDAWDD